jgi:hypothetical protein
MREADITYQYKLDELRMHIRHPLSAERVFIFVEGDSDIRFFRKLFDSSACSIEKIPGGNPKVEECTLHFSNMHAYVIGIRDADFLHLHDEPYAKTNMFLTDFHDMEMGMVAEDEVFATVISVYVPIDDQTHASHAQKLALREKIIRYIDNVSLLKFLNYKNGWGLNFPHGFYGQHLAFDAELNFDEYLKRTLKEDSPDTTTIKTGIENLRQQLPHPLQLCNGHDFVHALALYIKNAGWDRGLADATLEKNLLIAYRFEHWRKTQLYAATSAWALEKQRRIYSS